jgi:hypothetical protein
MSTAADPGPRPSAAPFVDQAGRQYRTRPGRRPSPESACRVFVIRLTTRQREDLQAAAEVNGVTPAEFCRDALDSAIGDCMEGASAFRRSRITETR